jgi:hypothetical protein
MSSLGGENGLPQPLPQRAALSDKKALIAQVREFVTETVRNNPDYTHFRERLESDQIYLKLRPYLSDHFKYKVVSGGLTVISIPASRMPGIATAFVSEIDRLEKEWGLQI